MKVSRVLDTIPYYILLTLFVIYVTLLSMIFERAIEIRRQIEAACARAGRAPDDVRVVAVTKYAPVEQVDTLLSAGWRDIGESRVQDASRKFDILEKKGFVFKRHMIGHLQSNKARDAVRLFDMIQSVDSLKTARQIDRYAAEAGRRMDILVQVNASQEGQKSGIAPDQALRFLEEVSVFPHVKVSGLMTIGPLSDDSAEIARCFEQTRSVFESAKRAFAGHPRVEMACLSMGMSGDYAIAIAHGSNMVRIGSAIFDDR